MNKNKRNKPILKFLKIGALSLIGVIVIAFGSIYVAHQISLKNEESKIESYGQKIDVFDGTMNVLVEGKGKETVVLLTGYGTASPGLDFKPLIKELKTKYKVVVIEPFGYGLSSQTKRERTAENMVEEIHAVTEKLKLDSFILMGHSIAGINGLNYVNTYPENVEAFVGIDSSTPNQPWPGFKDAFPNFLQKSGIFRLMVKLNPESFKVGDMDDATFEQIRLLTMKNMSNETMRKEGYALDQSFESAKKLSFPKELPVLLFVAEKNESTLDGWLELHQEQIAHSVKGEVIELPGTHYLHHTQSKQIVKDLNQFLN
ncbi:alpha/beta fold hydrolase [Carnobacterium maltaromaticum]